MRFKRLAGLVYSYTLGRKSAQPSTADFWYRQAFSRVRTAKDFETYLRSADPYPLYLFDQTVKLGYPSVDEKGVVSLHYGEPIGDQHNPEAGFQYALGLSDKFLLTKNDEWRQKFLDCTDFFAGIQDADGGFPYFFDYAECKSPWTSALAQARGASVMVRAWMLTGRDDYLNRASQAVSKFDLPVENGGYLASFEPTGSPYFEEYPEMRSTVINGFLSTVFGLFELSHWGKDERARNLLEMAYDSLESMLPAFEEGGWTVYDRRPGESRANPHSAFYHEMMVEYLRVLAVIEPRESFKAIRDRWAAMSTPWNRAKATYRKLLFKVAVR